MRYHFIPNRMATIKKMADKEEEEIGTLTCF